MLGYLTFLTTLKGTGPMNTFAGLLCAYLLYKLATHQVRYDFLPDKKFLLACGIWVGSFFVASFIKGDSHSTAQVTAILWHVAWPFGLLYIATRAFSYERYAKYAFAVAGIINCIIFMEAWQRSGWKPSYITEVGYGVASSTQVLLLTVPFIFLSAVQFKGQRIWRGVAFFGLGCTFFAIFLQGTRGAVLAFVGASIVAGAWAYAVRGGSYVRSLVKLVAVVLPLFAILGAGLFWYGQKTEAVNNTTRQDFIRAAVDMWRDNPVCGIGFSNWEYVYPDYRDPKMSPRNFAHPHNDYAKVLSETGTVGAVGYAFFVIVLLLYLLRRIYKQPANLYLWAIFWAYVNTIVRGCCDTTMFHNSVTWMLFGYMGLSLGSADRERIGAIRG